jgi:hypothetical protein
MENVLTIASPTGLRRLLAICAAAPPLAAFAISAVIVMTAPGGAPPFWRGGPLTLSEASALHDQGELVRLIAAGANPNAVYPLRAGIVAARALTPLEAAVGARRAEMVDLLMRHGATADPATWRRLDCFAQQTGAADVVEMLRRYRSSGIEASCAGVSTPFQ